jgi:hypothetical protein
MMKRERSLPEPKNKQKEASSTILTSEHLEKRTQKKNLDVSGFRLLNKINKIIKTRLGLATHQFVRVCLNS